MRGVARAEPAHGAREPAGSPPDTWTSRSGAPPGLRARAGAGRDMPHTQTPPATWQAPAPVRAACSTPRDTRFVPRPRDSRLAAPPDPPRLRRAPHRAIATAAAVTPHPASARAGGDGR